MLKVGIIGCGAISQRRHLPEYDNRQDVEIIAVCDMNLERAKEIAAKLGIKYAFQTHEELLELEEIQAVSVCTPNHLHASVAIQAMNKGKHVLCEKPMATTLEDARRMLEAARLNNVYLMVGHNQRLMPVHMKAKALLEQGVIGKVLSFTSTFGHSGPENWSIDGKSSWFFNKGESFAGALGDLGIHKADLLRWLLSDEVEEIQAMTGTLHKDTNVDDHAVLLLRMANGAIGVLTASWTYYPNENNSTLIQGVNGTLKIGTDSQFSIVVEKTDGTRECYETEKISTNETLIQPSSGIIDHFVTGILYGHGHQITGEDGYKALEIILAGIESAENKKLVSLDRKNQT